MWDTEGGRKIDVRLLTLATMASGVSDKRFFDINLMLEKVSMLRRYMKCRLIVRSFFSIALLMLLSD